ncbi:MAG: hypothetical protein ACLP29_10110 [Dissulfurispiraceae bacterium]|jgi:hypothetical protein
MPYIRHLIIASISIMALIGCSCYSTTLINAQGQMITCEAKGKNCSVAGYHSYEECVRSAKAQGFREVPYYQHEYPK